MSLTSLLDTWFPFTTTINASRAAIASEILTTRILDEDHSQQAGTAWKMALKAQLNITKTSKGIQTSYEREVL